MNTYMVIVRYIITNGESVSTNTINIMRKASNASIAISTVSALFGSLSNYKDSNGNPYLAVGQVTANLISSDSSDEPEPEPEPEPDVTPENTNSEDNTTSEE